MPEHKCCHHISWLAIIDDQFIEARRRGLVRFINICVRHPVLRDDSLLHCFLSEQSELGSVNKTGPDLTPVDEFLKEYPNEEDVDTLPAHALQSIECAKVKAIAEKSNVDLQVEVFERMAHRFAGSCFRTNSKQVPICYAQRKPKTLP